MSQNFSIAEIFSFIDSSLSLLNHIGTHYIQDIDITSSATESGQIDISCKFLVNSSLAMGYLAIIYSQDRGIHYLITENEEYVTNMLTGLTDGKYSVLLYTINETGLPFEQPAGFPQTVLIDNQDDYSGMYMIRFLFSI